MPNQEVSRDGIPPKVGIASDDQPDFVAPSGVNERDSSSVEGAGAAGGTLDFNDAKRG